MDNKIYDIVDIQIIDVCRGEETVRNSRGCYDCTVTIDGKTYIAKWYPSDQKYLSTQVTARGAQNLLVIYVDGRKNTIQISDGVGK